MSAAQDAYRKLEVESKLANGWVQADTWFAAYDTARAVRMGRTSVRGLARLLGRRPLEGYRLEDET